MFAHRAGIITNEYSFSNVSGHSVAVKTWGRARHPPRNGVASISAGCQTVESRSLTRSTRHRYACRANIRSFCYGWSRGELKCSGRYRSPMPGHGIATDSAQRTPQPADYRGPT
jgi:hypothetical protein